MNYFDSDMVYMSNSTNTVVYFDWKTAIYIYAFLCCTIYAAKFEQMIKPYQNRNNSLKPECVFSFNMGWWILVKFTNIRQPMLKLKTHSGFTNICQPMLKLRNNSWQRRFVLI
jgi:hypothetical protein